MSLQFISCQNDKINQLKYKDEWYLDYPLSSAFFILLSVKLGAEYCNLSWSVKKQEEIRCSQSTDGISKEWEGVSGRWWQTVYSSQQVQKASVLYKCWRSPTFPFSIWKDNCLVLGRTGEKKAFVGMSLGQGFRKIFAVFLKGLNAHSYLKAMNSGWPHTENSFLKRED